MTIPAALLTQQPLDFAKISAAIAGAKAVDIIWTHHYRAEHTRVPYFTIYDGDDILTIQQGGLGGVIVEILIRGDYKPDKNPKTGGSYNRVDRYETRVKSKRGQKGLLKVLVTLADTLPLAHSVGNTCVYRKDPLK